MSDKPDTALSSPPAPAGQVCVAALQMNSGDSVADNLRSAEQLVAQAVAQGAQLLLLPENFAFMGRGERDKLRVAEPDGKGPIQDWLGQQSKKHRVTIIAGTVPIRTDNVDKVAPACCVYSGQGQRIARYDKIHLFDVDLPDGDEAYRESDGFVPGESPVSVAAAGLKVGLSVCYDLRFPELYRGLSAAGATLMTVPAAFTAATGEAHWEVLLRARAIENLCYVLASGQVGRHPNGRDTWGHSMLIDPWGKVVSRFVTAEELSISASQTGGLGFAIGTVDSTAMAQTRQRFPALQHRRLS